MPASGDPAPNVHIFVERKTSNGWWEGADTWAQTNSNGSYSLGLDNGAYRITANPFGIDGVSATSIELTVGSMCSPTCSANILLSPPNVTATIRVPGGSQTVARAWVGVERKRVSQQFEWWEWTGRGSESNESGVVNISVPVTDSTETYRLVVHSPWGSSTIYPRFTSNEFSLLAGTTTSAAMGSLAFPSANVNVVVRNGATPVANSWVSLEYWNGQYWQWADIGSSTSVNGRVSLYLPCLNDSSPCNASDYRLVVESPWGSSQALPRFTVLLSTVLNTSPVEGFRPVSFPSSNVSGRVMINSSTPNSNGWIEVFEWGDLDNQPATPDTAGSWLSGTPVNRSGQFSMFLPNGRYLLRVNTNGSLSEPPIEVIVTVSAGVFQTCAYRTSGTCSNGTVNVDVSFANRPKNVRIVVTRNGQPITTSAFVTLTSASKGFSISLVTNSSGEILASVPEASDYTVRAVVPISDSTVSSVQVTGKSIGALTDENRSSIPVDVP